MTNQYETDLQILKEHLQTECDNFMDDIMDKFNTVKCANCGEFIINTPEMNEENRELDKQPKKFTRQELIAIAIGFSIGQGNKEDIEKNVNWFLEQCNHEPVSHKQDDKFFFNIMGLAVQLYEQAIRGKTD